MPADTFTTRLGLLLMGTGNDDSTWGDNLNAQVIQYIDDALRGRQAVATTGGSTTLTQAQTRPRYLDVSGALASTATLVVPNVENGWIVVNNTTNAFGLLVKTAAGSAISIPQGTAREVYCKAGNVVARTDADQVGAMFFHGGTSVPAGALECDGAAISRTDYVDLFNAVGTTWGAGNGSTTFNLPDLKTAARYLRARNGSNAIGTLQADTLAAHLHAAGTLAADSGGAHTHTGTTATESAHTHPSPALTDPGHTHTEPISATNSMQAGASSTVMPGSTTATSSSTTGITIAANTGAGSAHSHTFTTDSGGAHTHSISGSTASTGATETRPITAVAMACIRI